MRARLAIRFTFIVTGLSTLATGFYLAHWGRGDGLDLQVYRAGIAGWNHGDNPYLGVFSLHHLHFTYPPFALVALSPLSWAPFEVAQVALWFLSVGSLAVTVYIVAVKCGRSGGWRLFGQSFGWACLAVLVVEPVRSTLDYGQINTILMCMVVIDLLVVPRQHRGWLVGVAAAIKLTPLVFLLMPLLERDWKTLIRGLVGSVGLTAMMWLWWPAVVRTYFTTDISNTERVGNVAYLGNQSIFGALHRWPFPADGDTAAWLALSVVFVVMGLFIASRSLAQGDRVRAMLSLALIGLLISPISWTHHWVWVALIPPALSMDDRRTLRWSIGATLWVLFGVSVLAPYWWFRSGVLADVLDDSLVLVAIVAVATWFWAERGQPIVPTTSDPGPRRSGRTNPPLWESRGHDELSSGAPGSPG